MSNINLLLDSPYIDRDELQQLYDQSYAENRFYISTDNDTLFTQFHPLYPALFFLNDLQNKKHTLKVREDEFNFNKWSHILESNIVEIEDMVVGWIYNSEANHGEFNPDTKGVFLEFTVKNKLLTLCKSEYVGTAIKDYLRDRNVLKLTKVWDGLRHE